MQSFKSICFITPSTIYKNIGGAEVQIQILANEMAKRNKKVYLLTAPDQIPSEDNSNLEYIPFLETDDHQKDLKSFSNLINKINPDILYQRGRKLWTWYTGCYAIQSKCRFIFATSMDIDCYKTKFLFRKPRSAYEMYRSIKNFKKNYTLDRQTLIGMKSAYKILTQTKTQQSLIYNNLNLNSSIFPNVHPVSEKRKIEKSTPPNIVWIANLKKWKQPEVFLNLVKEFNQLNVNFIMAGKVSDRKYHTLIDETKSINPNFSFLGQISLKESNRILDEASIFINTSGMEEGFPNTFIQAWLRKTPTITLNFDPDNLIQEHSLGFKTDGYNDLSNTIKLILSDSDLREKMGNLAYNFAMENFSIENNINKFIDLISH